ncbi:hypothetical protein [Teredinibacter purpureus]|uniref:hypothetical protein n=1 Tax=Teredinibacter purpureus TaxID=2731756 RepID=UPI0005F85C5B|nr:hypothetical protein [Teredinibacter purpureus]
MLKRFAIFTALVAVCTMVALAYVTARFIDKEEILRAQNEMQALKKERDQLGIKVSQLTEKEAELNQLLHTKSQEIAINKQRITQLEEQRQSNQVSVRMLRGSDAQFKKFVNTFPEVAAASGVGVTKVIVNEELNLGIDYLAFPLGFAQTFVIEHEAFETLKAEVAVYRQNEALYGSVIELKDEVISLKEEKATAYREGYETAYARYEDINKKYVDLLEKPPSVEFKAPNKWVVLGCSAIGVAIGVGL